MASGKRPTGVAAATVASMEKTVFRPKTLDELVTWYEDCLKHLEDVSAGLRPQYTESLNSSFQEHALRLRAMEAGLQGAPSAPVEGLRRKKGA